jgi:membrane protease YdiL (CAAX protease family)
VIEPVPAASLVRLGPARLTARWLEMLSLYLLLPGLLAAAVDRAGRGHGVMRSVGLGWLVEIGTVPGRLVFPVLLATTALIMVFLLVDRSFDNSQLWGWRRARADLGRVVTWWCVLGIGLLGVTAWMAYFTDWLPESGFLRLPRERPEILVFIWFFYPWVSAYPQEVTHRVFFWHRYGVLFPNRWALIVCNALVFAWMHALFWNWVALVMTFLGGLLFAYTYDRTRSGLAAGIEHGLYGAWCFTIGLGWFVFAGR